MAQPKIWAHRGASGYAPENTLVSFQKAIDLGADGIELDVQLTKDQQVIVLHDEWLNRTSNGTGWARDYTLEELRRLDFNQQFPEYGPQPIPTMEEVFALFAPTDKTINIELKTGIWPYPGIEEKVTAMAKEYGMEDRVIYSSFNHASALKVREYAPDAKVGFLYADGFLDIPTYGKRYGADALHPAIYLVQDPVFLAECKKLGLALHVWTVNDPTYVRMCAEAGIDAVITNYPDMARKVIEGTWVDDGSFKAPFPG